jgi:hypothetical protein
MRVCVIVGISDQGQHAVVSDGHETYPIAYAAGRSIVYGEGLVVPTLGQNHRQNPPKSHLKLPRVGDAVVLETSEQGRVQWAYLDSYLDAIHRVKGSDFRPDMQTAA